MHDRGGGEEGVKHGALEMTKFTSYSELASCISSWGKRNSEQVTKNYFWLFEYPWQGRFLTFQIFLQMEA